jgi:predicted component of type VI protein secretion system
MYKQDKLIRRKLVRFQPKIFLRPFIEKKRQNNISKNSTNGKAFITIYRSSASQHFADFQEIRRLFVMAGCFCRF